MTTRVSQREGKTGLKLSWKWTENFPGKFVWSGKWRERFEGNWRDLGIFAKSLGSGNIHYFHCYGKIRDTQEIRGPKRIDVFAFPLLLSCRFVHVLGTFVILLLGNILAIHA